MKTNNKNTTHKDNNTKKQNNWAEYNQALKNRGKISIYIDKGILNGALLRPKRKPNTLGRPYKYPDALIELILHLRVLLCFPLRQTMGYMEDLFKSMELDTELPDYSTLSRRMGKLKINFQPNSTRRDKADIVMLIDSTGFKVFGEGEWKVRKHGYSYRRTWVETHIAVDYESRNIIALNNTTAHTHDNTQLLPLLDKVRQHYTVSTVIGDGAYDSKDNYLRIKRKLGIEFIAPPPRNATEHLNTGQHYQWYDTPGWEERNAVVRHIEEWGLDGWMADTDYHRRSIIENTIYRIKNSFGDKMKSRAKANQITEQYIKASLINIFNSLGLPKYNESF